MIEFLPQPFEVGWRTTGAAFGGVDLNQRRHLYAAYLPPQISCTRASLPQFLR